MMPDDIITRDGQGQLAVNTVSSTEANVPYNYDDCFTVDTNGRRALRVVGAGGGGSGEYLPQYSTMPAITESDTGKIVQYVGENADPYIKGGIYQAFPAGMTITNMPDMEYAEYFDVTAIDTSALQTFCENNIPSIIVGDEVALQGDIPNSASVAIGYYDSTWSGNPPTLHLYIYSNETFEVIYNNNDVTIDTDLETTINNMGITAESYELDDDHQISFEYVYSATGSWQPVLLSANAVTSVNGYTGSEVWLSAADLGAATKLTETITLLSANWVLNQQTNKYEQTVTSQWATSVVDIIVSPVPTDAETYASSGVLCTAQGYQTLTFACDTEPSSDIAVNVLVIS